MFFRWLVFKNIIEYFQTEIVHLVRVRVCHFFYFKEKIRLRYELYFRFQPS